MSNYSAILLYELIFIQCQW